MEFKKSFYCSVCHSKDSKLINLFRNTITISDNFCFKFVKEFIQYLSWKFEKFYRYQNKIYQYVSCFGRAANLTLEYPYEPIDNLIPHQFAEWNQCKQVTSVANISLCYPLCSKIKLSTYSKLIDGDRENLKRLYYYSVNTLRQYGIQFGTFDPKKAAALNSTNDTNSTTNPPKARILEETSRSVLYDLKPADVPMDDGRILQDKSRRKKNGTNGTNSTNATRVNETAFLSLIKSPLIGREEIQMMLNLFKNIKTSNTYTRKEHYNHDEISSARVTYFTVAAVNSMVNLTTRVKKSGLNSFNRTIGLQFEEDMKNVIVNGGRNRKSPAPLDKIVIKDCIDVSKRNVRNFNRDTKLSFRKVPLKSKTKTVKKTNQKLFARWNLTNDNSWVYPVYAKKNKTKKNKTEKGTPRNLYLNEEQSIGGSFLENLLFKVWF